MTGYVQHVGERQPGGACQLDGLRHRCEAPQQRVHAAGSVNGVRCQPRRPGLSVKSVRKVLPLIQDSLACISHSWYARRLASAHIEHAADLT